MDPLIELPGGIVHIVYFPDFDGYLGTSWPSVVTDKQDARVFANERAAAQFYEKTGLNDKAEIIPIEGCHEKA